MSQPAPSLPTDIAKRSVGKPRILLVDDEPELLSSLSRSLRRRFDVSTAANGPEALTLLGTDSDFAVIVSDMQMPRMNGAQFLAASRELVPQCTRILLTGQTDTDAAMAAVNDGQIFRYLTKPCRPDYLDEALTAAIARYRAKRLSRFREEFRLRCDHTMPQQIERAMQEIMVTLHASACALVFEHGDQRLSLSLCDSGQDLTSLDTPAAVQPLLDRPGLMIPASMSANGAEDIRHRCGTALSHPDGRAGWFWLGSSQRKPSYCGDDAETLQRCGTWLSGLVGRVIQHQETESAVREARALAEQAQRDPVTGLPLASCFTQRLAQLLKQGQDLWILHLTASCPEFCQPSKQTTRDAVRRQIAERLIRMTGDATQVGKSGNDFLVLMPTNNWVGPEAETHLTEQIMPALQGCMADGRPVHLVVHMGIAHSADEADAVTLLQRAESAMQHARQNGLLSVSYSGELHQQLTRRTRFEQLLREAVLQNQLELHYQPKIDIHTGAVASCEALLRWTSPELGSVSPVDFIPVMEETGLINGAGRWLIAEAARQRQAWTRQGLGGGPVAVNVSVHQLKSDSFIDYFIKHALAGNPDTPHLSAEITESILVDNFDAMLEKLSALREAGIDVAIDDFGTGYSSLSYLARFPANALKIDRAFISAMHQGTRDLSIVNAIISLAQSMRMKLIAEGVETADQLKLLSLLRVDEYQGFLFSGAVPGARFADILRESRS